MNRQPKVTFYYQYGGFLHGWHYDYCIDSTDGRYEFKGSSGPFNTKREAKRDYNQWCKPRTDDVLAKTPNTGK